MDSHIKIPLKQAHEEPARPDQIEQLKKIGISADEVLSQLGVHQANNIISFAEGARHVMSHFDDSFACVSATPEALEVNSAVTDAVTQANVKVLAEAPAMAMGSLYQTIGNSVAMAAANAVYAQQQANVSYQAASTLGVSKLISGN
jgi:hypothetical protein